jgi:hypothetical protein
MILAIAPARDSGLTSESQGLRQSKRKAARKRLFVKVIGCVIWRAALAAVL